MFNMTFFKFFVEPKLVLQNLKLEKNKDEGIANETINIR